MGACFLNRIDSLFGVQVDGNNESVQTQHLGKNEDQNHSYKQTRLLGSSSNTCITHYAYGKSSSQPTESYSQSSTKVNKTPVNKSKFSPVTIFII